MLGSFAQMQVRFDGFMDLPVMTFIFQIVIREARVPVQ